MRRAVRSAFVLFGVVALALSVTSPAGAATSPYSRTDAARDTVGFLSRDPVPRAKGDIVSMRIVHKATKVTLSFTVRQGTNPATSPAWAPGTFTEATWQIDTTGDFQDDFYVILGDRLAPSILAFNAAPVPCAATASFVAPATYRVVVPKSCLDDPARVRAKVGFVFGADDVTASSDIVPDSGFTPFVRPQ